MPLGEVDTSQETSTVRLMPAVTSGAGTPSGTSEEDKKSKHYITLVSLEIEY